VQDRRTDLAHSEHFGAEGVAEGGRFDMFTVEPWPFGVFDLIGYSLQ
jgi:hypothetical protein